MLTTAINSLSQPTKTDRHDTELAAPPSTAPVKKREKQLKSPNRSVFERLRRNRRQSPLFQRCSEVMERDDSEARCYADAAATNPPDARNQVKRDLFGVHIELYNLLIETERRKLKTLHCEMQQLSSSFPSLQSSRKYQHISYAKQRLGRLQAQLDQLEHEYRRAAYGALKSNHVNISGSSKSKLVAVECGTHNSHHPSSASPSSSTKAAQLAPPPMVKQQTARTRPSIFGSLAALSPRVASRWHNNNNNNNTDQKAANGNVNNNNILKPPTFSIDAVTPSSPVSTPHSSLPHNLSSRSRSPPSLLKPNRDNNNENLLLQSLAAKNQQHSTTEQDNNTRPVALDRTPNRRYSCVARASSSPESCLVDANAHLSKNNDNARATASEQHPQQQQYYRCVIPVVHISTNHSANMNEPAKTQQHRYRSPSAATRTSVIATTTRPSVAPPVLARALTTPAIPSAQKPPASRSATNTKTSKSVAPLTPVQPHSRQQHVLKQVRSTSAKRAAPTLPPPPKSPPHIIQVKKNGATIVNIGGAPPLPKQSVVNQRISPPNQPRAASQSDIDTDTEDEETDDDEFRANDTHDDTLRNILSSNSSVADYQLLTPTHTRELFRRADGPASICSSSIDSAILRESCSSCTHDDDLAAAVSQSTSSVMLAIASMCTDDALPTTAVAEVPHDDCVSASDSNYHSSSGSSIGISGVGSSVCSGGSDCDANSIQSQKAVDEEENVVSSRPSSSLLSQPPLVVVQELRYENGTLSSGTLDSLIAYFMPTSKHIAERTYSFAFVLSCRLFLRPEELLERVELLCIEHTELCEDPRSNSPFCSSTTPQKSAAAVGRKQTNLQHSHADWPAATETAGLHHTRCANEQETKAFCRHVNRMLSDWAETFPYDFRQEFLMLRFKSLSAFCSHYEPLLSVELDHTMQSLLQKLAELDEYEQHLSRISQTTLERMKSAVNLATPTTDVVQICPNPMIFAQQLTHVELERMQFIGPEEFVEAISDILKKKSSSTVATTKSSKSSRRRRQLHNLDAYVDWFNRLSYLVATEVCMQLRRKHRVRLIDFFIEVAKECFNLGNYNSLMAIVAGLNMSSVRRLKRTWRRVNNTVKLDVLENAMSPSQNFLHYRSTLKAAMWRSAGSTTVTEKIIVPFFSLLIKDVYFLKEGCAGTLSDGTINFTKFWQLAKQVSEFLAWREVVCPFERRPNVIDYVLTTAVFSETGLALASFECEAPETASERDRCRQLKLALNQTPCPGFGAEVK